MVIFHSFLFVYQRVMGKNGDFMGFDWDQKNGVLGFQCFSDFAEVGMISDGISWDLSNNNMDLSNFMVIFHGNPM